LFIIISGQIHRKSEMSGGCSTVLFFGGGGAERGPRIPQGENRSNTK